MLTLAACGQSGVIEDPVGPPVLSGQVETRAVGGGTVEVQGSAADADRWAGLVGPAVAQARAVLKGSGALVHLPLFVEVARDEASLEEALHVSSGTEKGVEAVSAFLPAEGSGTVPRIWVDAQAMGDLTDQGIRIVLAHEATHVLTGIVGNTAMPTWLMEGFADYVALRDVDKPLTVTAGRILAQVRHNGIPKRLPLKADFDAAQTVGGDGYTAEYEGSWLACRLLAQRGGERALFHLYVAVRNGSSIQAALHSTFDLTLAQLTRLWQNDLRSRA